MAINPKCSRCGEELMKPGAILLSPPNKLDICKKEHICVKCFPKIAEQDKIIQQLIAMYIQEEHNFTLEYTSTAAYMTPAEVLSQARKALGLKE